MIKEFVEAFEKNETWVREYLKENRPYHYMDVITAAIRGITVDPELTENWLDAPTQPRKVCG